MVWFDKKPCFVVAFQETTLFVMVLHETPLLCVVLGGFTGHPISFWYRTAFFCCGFGNPLFGGGFTGNHLVLGGFTGNSIVGGGFTGRHIFLMVLREASFFVWLYRKPLSFVVVLQETPLFWVV